MDVRLATFCDSCRSVGLASTDVHSCSASGLSSGLLPAPMMGTLEPIFWVFALFFSGPLAHVTSSQPQASQVSHLQACPLHSREKETKNKKKKKQQLMWFQPSLLHTFLFGRQHPQICNGIHCFSTVTHFLSSNPRQRQRNEERQQTHVARTQQPNNNEPTRTSSPSPFLRHGTSGKEQASQLWHNGCDESHRHVYFT